MQADRTDITEADDEAVLGVAKARYNGGRQRYMVRLRDPIGIRGGLNVYCYVADEPVTRVDPYGLRDDAAWESYHRRRDELRRSESQDPAVPGPVDIAAEIAFRHTGKKSDKWMHFVVSCKITAELPGGYFYIIPGSFVKEVVDLIGGADWTDSLGDILCNLAGFASGPGAALGACDCEEEADQLGL